jgi:pimeloyl-ACP methyl ester carboxylesterase
MWNNWLRKICATVFSVLAILTITGMLYQTVSTRLDDEQYPPPGRLVTINGCNMHILCLGEQKKPTVVLESGLGGCSLDWILVQSEIAKFARVVSYDRAGYGWSDTSPNPRTSREITNELHTLLMASGIEPPYILVGHSFGGVNVRLYANQYPDEVRGLVLVDAVHELQAQKLPPVPERSLVKKYMDMRNPQLIRAVAPLGFQRFLNAAIQSTLPFAECVRDLYLAKVSTTKYLQAVCDEIIYLEESLRDLANSTRTFGNKPLTVISAGKEITGQAWGVPEELAQRFDKAWKELQRDLVTQSTQGKQIIAKNSGHAIPWHQPDIIIQAVREMVEKTK